MSDSFHSANAETKGVQARYYKTLGRFNLIGAEKNWQLVLVTSAGNASALFDEDNEPEIQNLVPGDVLDMIEERTRQGWSSNQAKRLQGIAEIREQIDALDIAWLADALAVAEAAYERAKKRHALFIKVQEVSA